MDPTKSRKDIDQASVLLAVLATTHPGAIESAVAALPKRAVKHLRAALDSLRPTSVHWRPSSPTQDCCDGADCELWSSHAPAS